jgi:chromodomain-helicase-DNA-binding protein 7
MECPTSSALDVSRSRGDEVGDAPQDFSLPSKSKKSKLDDMLDKLMKRKQEEPPQGKEKKRRKLDEIVMGLSSARDQQVAHTSTGVAELIKKTAASISVVGGTNNSPAHQQPPSHLPPPPTGATLHPLLRAHVHKGSPAPSNHPPSSSSKPPFTITVTSVPSSAASSSSRAPPPPMPPISSASCKVKFTALLG